MTGAGNFRHEKRAELAQHRNCSKNAHDSPTPTRSYPSEWKGKVRANQTIEGHIEALTKISKAITSDRYIEDVLRLVVTVTAETMRSKICSLWLLDGNDNAFKLRATQSLSEDYLRERSLKMGKGIVGQVALTRKPRAVINVLEEPDYKEKGLAGKECPHHRGQ